MKNLFGNWKFFSNDKKNTTKKQQKKGILNTNEKLRYVSVAQNMVHGMDVYLLKYLDSVRAMVDTSQIERNYTNEYKKYYQSFKQSFIAVKQRAEKHKEKVFGHLAIFITGGILLYIGIKKGFEYLVRQVKKFYNLLAQIGSSFLEVVDGILDTTQMFLRRTFHVDIDIKFWLQKIGKCAVNAMKQIINMILDGLWYLFCDDTTAVQFIGQMLNQVAIAAYNASFDSALGWVMNILFSRVQGARRKIDLSGLSKYGVDAYSKVVGVQSRFNSMLSDTSNIKGVVTRDGSMLSWGSSRPKDELVSMDAQWTVGWDGDASSWGSDVLAHSETMRINLAQALQKDTYDRYSQGQFVMSDVYGQFGHTSYQQQGSWYEDSREFDPNSAVYIPTQENVQNGCPRAMDLVKQVDDFIYKYRNQKSQTFQRIREKWAILRFQIMKTYEQGYSWQHQRANPNWKGGITYRQLRQLQALLYQIYVWQGKTLQKRIRMHDIMFHNRVQNSLIDKLLLTQQATLATLRQKNPLDEIVEGYMGYRLTFADAISQAIDILKYAQGVLTGGDEKLMDSSYGTSGAKLLTRHQFDRMFGNRWLGIEMYKARNYFKRISYLRKGWEKVILVNDLENNFDLGTIAVGNEQMVGGTHDAYSRQSSTGVRQSGDGSAIDGNNKTILIFAIRQMLQNLAEIKQVQLNTRNYNIKLIRDCTNSIYTLFDIWKAELGKQVTVKMTNENFRQVTAEFGKEDKEWCKIIPDTFEVSASSQNDLSSWQKYENTQRQSTCASLGIPFVYLQKDAKPST